MHAAKIMATVCQDSPFVEENVLKCVRKIIADIKKNNPDIEFNDNTYREIYIMCQEFSKRLEDVLASEASRGDTSIFGTAVNYNYYNQQRMF